MGYSHYERLSALDAMFLQIENENQHMHVGAVALFDAGPLTSAEGLLDFPRIRAGIEIALQESPRCRQRLARVPLYDHPVWIDDERFKLDYHLRHTSLPRPGHVRDLKRLAGRILSQKLDRAKPLWEMWVVEGIEGDRFAMIFKAHHCMVDGIAGFDLLARMMRLDPDPTVAEPRSWIPRPPPSGLQLVRDESLRRAALPFALAGDALRGLGRPREVIGELQESALGVREALGAGLRPTSSTPLNPDIGPYRRYDWLRLDLAAVREVRNALGGTVNDVVLACVTGAVARFLKRRGLALDDQRIRAQVPVSIRTRAERGSEGNRVAMLLLELPVAEVDPVRRLKEVVRRTRELKASRQRAGVAFLEDLSDQGVSWLFLAFARLAVSQRAFNLVVTNIPGPQRPVYLLGARMLAIHPVVPLARNQALGIALFSYDGGVYWGINADWDALPDLHEVACDLEEEFEQLRKLAGAPSAASEG